MALAALWPAAVSRVHVNASWSDEAWGYLLLPLLGAAPEVGDRVLFEPPEVAGSPVPYLKTVRGVPGMAVTVDADGTVFLDGVAVGRAKSHALDGRPLAAVAPGIIPAGHYYLHADHPDSHDSRYAEIGPRAPQPHPRTGDRHAGYPVAGPERTVGRAGGCGAGDAGGGAAMRRPIPPSLPALCVALMLAAPVAGIVSGALAKDLGVLGATWPVAEPDLLDEIEARLMEMERSGALARLEEEARERARQSLEEPDPVPGIAPAREERGRVFDPAVTLARDIRGPDGALIAAAGTRVNPLERMALTRDLLFVDGRREAEIDWALERMQPGDRPVKIVLLAGRPLDLMRRHGRSFFFDAGGRLAERFAIRATPTLVEQEGRFLRLTEIPDRSSRVKPGTGARIEVRGRKETGELNRC